jgi:hypothetical protein
MKNFFRQFNQKSKSYKIAGVIIVIVFFYLIILGIKYFLNWHFEQPIIPEK